MKNFKPLEHKDVMPFGKYKGRTMGAILKEDPGYIVWLIGNTDCSIDNQLGMNAESFFTRGD